MYTIQSRMRIQHHQEWSRGDDLETRGRDLFYGTVPESPGQKETKVKVEASMSLCFLF